jgi:glycosyltransferase involved in cell wall biosynthesis
MITYNHEPFIKTAIESVLAQETSFHVELVIGEDCSSDATREIVRAYAGRFPDRIRLLLPQRNLGMIANFIATMRECRGRYVGLLEGDDYWTDAGKLTKQVRHLEATPECSVSFHNAYVERPDGNRVPFHEASARSEFSGSDLWEGWLIPTASAVFRNPRLEQVPRFLDKATHGDLSIFLLMAEVGRLDYIDEIMSVYRLHEGGVTTSFAGIDSNRREIDFLWALDDYFEGRYRRYVETRVSGLERSTALHLAARGERRAALRSLLRSWRTHPRVDGRAVRESLHVGLDAVAPGLYQRTRTRLGRPENQLGGRWFDRS